jgi:hypothetical protein
MERTIFFSQEIINAYPPHFPKTAAAHQLNLKRTTFLLTIITIHICPFTKPLLSKNHFEVFKARYRKNTANRMGDKV